MQPAERHAFLDPARALAAEHHLSGSRRRRAACAGVMTDVVEKSDELNAKLRTLSGDKIKLQDGTPQTDQPS